MERLTNNFTCSFPQEEAANYVFNAETGYLSVEYKRTDNILDLNDHHLLLSGRASDLKDFVTDFLEKPAEWFMWHLYPEDKEFYTKKLNQALRQNKFLLLEINVMDIGMEIRHSDHSYQRFLDSLAPRDKKTTEKLKAEAVREFREEILPHLQNNDPLIIDETGCHF